MPLDHEVIDIFCHFLPPVYCAAVHRLRESDLYMFHRAEAIPALVNIEERFRVMDQFSAYRQIPSIASPPPEALADSKHSPELARVANDAFADLSARHSDRFAGFVATLPLNNPDAAYAETERAVTELGAAGIQVFTSVGGQPLDRPEYLALFELAAKLNCAVWLHPIRPMTVPDYPAEAVSKFDLWWALAWPHETSVAMGRLIFSGLFDRHPELIVITHHVGGTVPMLEGRLGAGLDLLGTRTPPAQEFAIKTPLRERPLDALRRFHADTASFGSRSTIECGLKFFGVDQLLFGTDMPFDPEGGPGFIRATLAALDEMDLTPKQRRAILSENARRILKIATPP